MHKRRTGPAANLGDDSRAEDPHFCLGLESRASEASKLSGAEPLNRLTQLEQAPTIWAGRHFNGAWFSLSTEAWAGMRALRMDERPPRAGPSISGPPSTAACFYAGVVRYSCTLDTVCRHSTLHNVPTLVILAGHLAVVDSHSSGPLLDWPLPRLLELG